jgi:membrane protease YdiL (CAAX protease family)
LSAGVGEEVIYRGFLIWYLTMLSGNEPVAVALAAAVFGVAHLYQGPRSAVKVAVLALALGALYVACDALWPVMVIHFAVDLLAGVFSIRLHEMVRADEQPASA